MTERPLPDNELCGVSTVKTINAVCSTDTILEGCFSSIPGGAVMEKTGRVDHNFSYCFKSFDYILITTIWS